MKAKRHRKNEARQEAPPEQVRFDPMPKELVEGGCQVTIASTVLQAIHLHARASMQTEVCGVLIGEELDGGTLVEAAIAGESAAQGGAHVTFTKDTWEHIYSVKDRDYPEKRIVGWYHSHPGFGIFLSKHDTFIHENFFSAPFQVAWVYDPQAEEEGCFGWVEGELRRLSAVRLVDTRHDDQPAILDEPELDDLEKEADDDDHTARNVAAPAGHTSASGGQDKRSRFRRRAILLFSLALVFVAGLAAGLTLLPRTLVMYSLPDGRLLTDAEAQAAVQRALDLQRELRLKQQQGGSDTNDSANPANGGLPAEEAGKDTP